MTQDKIYARVKNPAFAEWLRERLHQKRWKPADLARAMKTQSSTVSRWLAGSVPHLHSMSMLEKLLGDSFWNASAKEPIPGIPAHGTISGKVGEEIPTTTLPDDGAILEKLLTEMSEAQLRTAMEKYLSRAERDPADRRAVIMARLLLSEANLRSKQNPEPSS